MYPAFIEGGVAGRPRRRGCVTKPAANPRGRIREGRVRTRGKAFPRKIEKEKKGEVNSEDRFQCLRNGRKEFHDEQGCGVNPGTCEYFCLFIRKRVSRRGAL